MTRTFIKLRQRECLKHLIRYHKRNGFYPTRAELAKLMGVSSVSAHRYIKSMADDGMISVSGRPRDIIINQ